MNKALKSRNLCDNLKSHLLVKSDSSESIQSNVCRRERREDEPENGAGEQGVDELYGTKSEEQLANLDDLEERFQLNSPRPSPSPEQIYRIQSHWTQACG